MTYQIGQIIPWRASAGSILGADLSRSQWHILKVLSGFERRLSDVLFEHGVHNCYPIDTRKRRNAQGKTIEIQRASVPGYIFAKFDQAPIWSEMRRQKLIIGTVCRETPWGPVPYAATENDVRRFMGIPTVEEEIEEQRREALRVRPGDCARVLVGQDVHLAVMVKSVRSGRVFWETESGIRGETDERSCERSA